MGGGGGDVCLETASTQQKLFSVRLIIWGRPAEWGGDGGYENSLWGAQSLGSGNISLMNLLATLMNMGTNKKQKKKKDSERLRRQNQGKAQDGN